MIVTLPWPHRILSPNARVHWRVRAKYAAAAREYAFWLATDAGARPITADHLNVFITFHQPDKRRRDRDNMIGSLKSYCDGIADAIGVDDSKWTPTYHVGEPVKGGEVVVHFPEIKISQGGLG